MTDPRLPKLLPAMMTNVELNSSGNIISYEWKRDIGVDVMNSDVRVNAGPLNYAYANAPQTIKYTIADEAKRTAFIA